MPISRSNFSWEMSQFLHYVPSSLISDIYETIWIVYRAFYVPIT